MRTKQLFTVVQIHDGLLEAHRFDRDGIESWAKSKDYDSTALVFNGEPVALQLETVIRLGGAKTRKPRAQKAEAAEKPKERKTRSRNGAVVSPEIFDKQ